jgi:hypothetical protein
MRPSGLSFSARNLIKTLFPMLFFLTSPPSVASARTLTESILHSPPSDERVEWVGHEGMAMQLCGMEEGKGLEQLRFMGSDNTSK